MLAGRSFRRALTAASAMGPDRGGDRGVTRALTGWGAALALRARMASDAAGFDGFGAGSPGFAAEAAALAAAASEKYRAALQSPFVVDGGMSATARAAVFMDWGDALRLAAASAEASGGGGGGGGRSESDASSSSSSLEPEECWARAAQCYDEASRLDPEGCGALGVRNRNACDAALGTRRYGGHR